MMNAEEKKAMAKMVRGKVFVFGDNVDTDQIYPGKYVEYTEIEDIRKYAMSGSAMPDLVKRFHPGDIIVAGRNFGCGSSREHAAMEPRYLNVRVVLAKSLARIHESNLKKQGILALTFVNPADYDKIQEKDRISVLNLNTLAPNSRVVIELTHENGTKERFEAKHSYNEKQLSWFRAGSALNALKA